MTELQRLGHQQQAEKLRQLWKTREFRQNVARGQILNGRKPTEKTLCTEAYRHNIIDLEKSA